MKLSDVPTGEFGADDVGAVGKCQAASFYDIAWDLLLCESGDGIRVKIQAGSYNWEVVDHGRDWGRVCDLSIFELETSGPSKITHFSMKSNDVVDRHLRWPCGWCEDQDVRCSGYFRIYAQLLRFAG